MFGFKNDVDMLEKCSSNYGYRELMDHPKGKVMLEFYERFRELLKKYYTSDIDAEYSFEDPVSMKRCWKIADIDFGKYSLTWDEALTALQAVYADYPLFFFSEFYRTGGRPREGIISPLVDAECARGDFRLFYAKKIEEEIQSFASVPKDATSCRDAAYKVYVKMRNTANYDRSKGDGTRIKYPDIPSHSILNYVRNRSGVCEGFSKTYQAIMNYIGIPAVYVTVILENGLHACNLINLTDEKKWIMVDATVGVSTDTDQGFNMPPGVYKRYIRSPKDSEPYANQPEYTHIWDRFLEG